MLKKNGIVKPGLLLGSVLVAAGCAGGESPTPDDEVGVHVGAPLDPGWHVELPDNLENNAAPPPVTMPPDQPPKAAPLEGAERVRRPQVLRACRGGSVRVQRSEVLHAGTRDAFTLGLWVRLGDAGDQLLLQGDGVSIGVREGRFRATMGGGTLVGLNAVPDEWYHLALVKAGAAARLFVNGIPVDAREVEHEALGSFVFGSLSALRPSRDARCRWSLRSGARRRCAPSLRAPCATFEAVRLGGRAEHEGHFTPGQELPPRDGTLVGFSFDLVQSGPVVEDESGHGHHGVLSGDVRLIPGKI
jgi:hypothetical protein